jgi:hypothetical protein
MEHHMANLPPMATYDTPAAADIIYGAGNASGNINVGDFLIYSGYAVIPTAMGTLAQVKASAAGVALESNPVYDSNGAEKTNTALLFARQGRFRVSAFDNITASGDITLGTPVYPAATGSGVNAPTGNTGVGAQWAQTVRQAASGETLSSGMATVVGVAKLAAGYGATGSGIAQLDIVLHPARPDYY